jgi:hypothetical protein
MAQILGHKFGKFEFAVHDEIVGEIERQFFRQMRCVGIFSLGEKFGDINISRK